MSVPNEEGKEQRPPRGEGGSIQQPILKERKEGK